MNLTPYFIAWALLAVAIAIVAAWRGRLAASEDHFLHTVEIDNSQVEQQQKTATRIKRLDTWGKSMTILAVTSGAVLVAILLHHAWVSRGAA